MRNFFKTLSIAAAITTLMPAASHAFFRVSDPMTDLPDGAIVALQSPSTTGGSYYFFNGAAHKTAPTGDAQDPTYANFYVVHRLADTADGKATLTLKRISDGAYIGRSGNETVTNTTDAASAVQFVMSCPKTLHNETLTLEDMVDNVEIAHLIRLTVQGTNYKLNMQGSGSNPAFKTGTGGWSAWYINVYTAEEICALMPWLNRSDTNIVASNKSITFPENTFVSLQCLDYNGGSFYYFNGNTAKSAKLSTENLYKTCAGSTSGSFMLQRVSDNKYVGKSGGSVTMTDSESSAATFTAAVTRPSGWTTLAPGIHDSDSMTVRFTASGSFLNTSPQTGTPAYTTGTGGYSIWGVKVYPHELAMLMKKEEIANSIHDAWSRVVPSKELEAIENAIATTPTSTVTYGGNLHDTFNDIENSYAGVYDKVYSIVDGMIVTLNNVRRGGATPNYLYATDADDHMVNTHDEIDERSKWAIMHTEGTPYFHLLNPTTRGYIKQMGHNTHTPFTTDINEAGRYDLIPHPAVHNGEATGIMVKKHGESMALNVDNQNDPLVFWNNMSDAGSEWIMSFVETAAEEISSDGKYYRIRSHYGLTAEAGSFVAVNTVLGDEATESEAQPLKLTADPANIGTLWQLTAEGKLENVAADFMGHDRYGLTAEGIVDEASAATEMTAIDNRALACRISTDGVNMAMGDNETFYFEEVPAEEAQSIINEYIALSEAGVLIAAARTEISQMKNAPALWDAEKVAAAEAAAESVAALTVKTAHSPEPIAVPEDVEEAMADVYNSIIGKRFIFANRHDDNDGHHLYVSDGHLQSSSTESYDVRTVWEIAGTEVAGEYKLYNYHDQSYAGFTETNSGVIPASAEGETFRLEYPTEHWSDYTIGENEIVLHAITGTGSDHDSHYICDATNSDHSDNVAVTAFRLPHPGSHWIVKEASEGVEVEVSYNEATNNIEFSHGEFTVNVNELCSRLPMLYIDTDQPETEEEPAEFAPAMRAPAADNSEGAERGMLDNDNISQFLTGDLEAGNYRLEVPMGYFKVGDGYSKAFTEKFIKSDSGTVTSISEVNAEETAIEYFDLQGRRITHPAGGVYLMRRGSKVSKVLLR